MSNDSNQVNDSLLITDVALFIEVDAILATDDSLLTTEDNPYSPFDQWDEWYAFDVMKGYNTCAYLARMTRSSNELSEIDNNIAISRAMLSILEFNITGNYKKVTRKDYL
jgi:hypothetical protein